ncbi:MAG: hypothetical protein DBP02_01490 [gamma proteobacterium symbiont of Ctena orbiculata]|nr:MAG: hypothetical protein DBP02_01490 [gamma proteobacterium symbiont of Ctena orbiculata]
MSPNVYSSLGNKYNSKKLNLWLVALVAFLVVTGTAVFSEKINTIIPFQVPFGIALIILILAWGILLAVYWYGPEGKLEPRKIASYEGVKRKLGGFMSWYGSIFLTLWFLSGITILPWFLIVQAQS